MHTRCPAHLVVANTKLSIDSSPWVDISAAAPPAAHRPLQRHSLRLDGRQLGGVNPLGKAHELFAQPRAHFRFVIRGKIKIIGRTCCAQGAEAFGEAFFGGGERLCGIGQYRAD